MTKLNQAGFSLIEVMISVFVLALGVIGAAGMQLTALRTTQQSVFQTTALELAAEMADKMRSNDQQMRLPDNLFLQVNYVSSGDSASSAGASSCYSTSANCNAGELAKFDIHEWEKRIKASLPDGRARICHDASPWNSSAGTFNWECSGSASGNAALVIKIGWRGKKPDGSLVKDDGKQFPPMVVLPVEPYTK